jgi:subtilisin family serine protease
LKFYIELDWLEVVMKALFSVFVLALILAGAQTTIWAAPSVDRLLQQQIASSPLAFKPVIITFDRKPTSADFLMLKSLGITGGQVLRELPIILTKINGNQFNALRLKSGIRSLYANHTFKALESQSNKFIGVTALQTDGDTITRNGGLPVSGKNVGVAYVDTGIDATHPDLKLGENVVQNVLFPTAEVPLNLPPEFVPVLPVENQPLTDVEGGHGTFGAGVLAGTGAASGGFYQGVAPGAKLIGLTAGNDAGLSTFAIVQALDYALVNQYRYNIRVCNNSYGTTLTDYPYDPLDPVNTATRIMHDRNITVVFAAGNDGDGIDKINPFSVAPWVISVAAGEKQGLGTPAGFSSRGNDNGTGTDTPGQPADEFALPNLRPDITGSGVDIKSARSKGPGVTNLAGTIPVFVGANDISTIPPAFLPFYTTSQGTSFSSPQVSGVIALMLEANPLLTPDEVVTILRQSATPMPYEERIVGAGYVDARNAVRQSMALSAVEHPANLFPSTDPNAPQIIDATDDQLGTTAQDIRQGRFAYDAAANQIVYTLTLADLSVTTPNMRWTMTSKFGVTDVFVTASVNETNTTYKYGKITTLATGTRNQETIGDADSGELRGNQIIIRLGLNKINSAVGASVAGTVSTATQAQSQIIIGSSLSGGLLLNSDAATGSDFTINNQPNTEPTATATPTVTPTTTPSETPMPSPTATPIPEPTPTVMPTPEPTPAAQETGKFEERYSGTINVGQNLVELPFTVRRSTLDSQINQNQGSQSLVFELLDGNHNVIATTTKNKITLDGLSNGTYFYRVRGNVSRAVDFTIKSIQGK